MASLQRKARASSSSDCAGVRPVKKELAEVKEVSLSNEVIELSVTVGYLGADVKKEEIHFLDLLIRDHCVQGLAALERGDVENNLHFQMVVRARCKSARSFGILVRKYMGWHGCRAVNHVGKVVCKVLTNRFIHTFKGMVGYCLKDTGSSHFEHVMYNISDDDVFAGKTLHTIYGRSNLKSRVTLTNKNNSERMYVWHKYKTDRQLTATFLSTLTGMISSGLFIPAASWIIPMSGQGMDHRCMRCLFKCMIDPLNCSKDDVQEVFVKKRQFVKGRYFDDDGLVHDMYQPLGEDLLSGHADLPSDLTTCTPKTPNGTLERFPVKATFKVPQNVSRLTSSKPTYPQRVLFEDTMHVEQPSKSLKCTDILGEFLPLKNKAPMVVSDFLATNEVVGLQVPKTDRCRNNVDEDEFWKKLSANPVTQGSGCRDTAICLSDSEEDDCRIVEQHLSTTIDRSCIPQKPPLYKPLTFEIKSEPQP